MRSTFRWALSLTLAALALVTLAAFAQAEPRRFFYETGHWVTGDFLAMYERAKDPVRLYGYPITEAFVSPDSPNLTIQYFQKARFELHPENLPELRISLSPLGKSLFDASERGLQAEMPPNFSACQRFEVNGFPVCHAFLDFFKAYGGLEQFGYPISAVEIQDGYRVQFFQKARFEWHPELPAGQRVTLTNLGQIFFTLYERPDLQLPYDNIPDTILDLKVQAFVSQPVIAPDGTQTWFVIVRDQQLSPIQGASITYSLSQGSDVETVTIMPSTNDKGISTAAFKLTNQPFGLTEIRVEVIYDVFVEGSITSFRVWW